ncbi:MAG: hypothetical protein JXB88_10150 [Spirochaetales bacterium]|nr:hypothetical protein [Spirochaetales bacterium]
MISLYENEEKLILFLSEINKAVDLIKREKGAELIFDNENIKLFLEEVKVLKDEYINLLLRVYSIFDDLKNFRDSSIIQKDCLYLIWDKSNFTVFSIKDSIPILTEIVEYKQEKNKVVLFYPDTIKCDRSFLAIIKDGGEKNIPIFTRIDFVSDYTSLENWIVINRIPRKFKHNPKHPKAKEINKNKYVSALLCSEEEAQILLNSAIGDAGFSNKLYNYDTKNKKYIIFQDDDTQENTYHGYHAINDTEIPEIIKTILNKRR